jgi:hypothetical protein
MHMENELIDGPAPLSDGEVCEVKIIEITGIEGQYSKTSISGIFFAKVLLLY